MDKRQLRIEARRQREAAPASPADARAAAAHLLAHIRPHGVPPIDPPTVALFWPKPDEFDTRPLIAALLSAAIPCALPVMEEGSLILHFALWDGRHPLIPGPHGVRQPPRGAHPVRPGIVVLPLLAFDDRGVRLGYGGGYYDATIAALRRGGPLMAVGIGLDSQRSSTPLPDEPHDERLDAMLTPSGLRFFPGAAGES